MYKKYIFARIKKYCYKVKKIYVFIKKSIDIFLKRYIMIISNKKKLKKGGLQMKLFTIETKVTEGARVDSFTLKGAGISIPAIIVGEEGRGRELGVLPVQLLPDSYAEWQEKGYVNIHFATVGTTKSGKPKLFQAEDTDTTDRCICVFRTKIGFRGGNSHTGDRIRKEYPTFHPFPGEILCEGIIAQGDAGRMGSGKQLVAVMPANIVFRTGYSGRLYGAPSAHYYIYRDGQILSATWDERGMTEIF